MVEYFGFEFPYADDKYHDPAYEFKVIGKRVPCYDGYKKVTGKANYSGDVYLPNMLHAKILRSPVAHANIISINTSKAKALSGVRAVVTYEDRADKDTMRGSYQDHFLVDKVRQWGDPIAAVAAVTEEIAEDALDLIEVEYEELPVILEFEEAIESGAPLINEPLYPGNITSQTTLEKGDIEQGFQDSDVIIERDYTTAQTSILNPVINCCVASYEDGILTVWQRNQEIAAPAKQIPAVVGIPLSNIRVIAHHGEGGYSSGVTCGWSSPVAALLAVKTGKPVRLESEIENMTILGGRYPMQLHLKIGVKEDGTISALDGKGDINGGAYGWIGSARSFTPSTTLNYYTVENARYILTGTATNRGGITQWRGYGAIMAWPMDALMDEVAEIMGFDTLEFRKKNCPSQWELVQSFGKWVPMTSTGKAQIFDKLSQAIGWTNKWSPPNTKTGSFRKGIGIGTGEKSSAMGGGNVIARLDPDGSVSVFLDASDMGVAIHTSQAQIVAEILELPIEKIKPVWGDSFHVPQTMQAVSSRMCMAMGTASRRAAESILQQLFEKAALQLDVNIEELEVDEGMIQIKEAPETAIPFGTLVGSGNSIVGVGDHPGASWFRSNFCMNIQSGSAYEAEVDMETGAVKFLKTVNSIDCGRAINPDIVEGQVIGAGMSQFGAAMMHEVVYDRTTGVVLNTSHVDYLYPTAADIPPTEAVLVESIDPFTAFGQKGVGEPGMCSPAQGVINTIANATGVRVGQIPINPDVLLKALGKI